MAAQAAAAGLRPVPPQRLIRLLADGGFRSGEALARELGVTRTAVWKQVQALAALGLEVHAVRGKGYRLAMPIELLDADRVREALAPERAARLDRLDVVAQTDSTNAALLAQPAPPPGHACACLAEHQLAGRGRRGRRWLAPYGSGLCLSVGRSFDAIPAEVGCLSLATGVALLRALRAAGTGEVALKWPNDLLARGAKLGGILVELRGEHAGPAYVVAGIGLNLRLAAAAAEEVDASGGLTPIDLHRLAPRAAAARNRLAGAVLDGVLAMFDRFAEDGFASFAGDWRGADALADCAVRVEAVGEAPWGGVARGIAADGALLVESGGAVRRVVSGDVSVRPQ